MKITIVELRSVLQGLVHNLSYRDIQRQSGVPKTSIGRIVSKVIDRQMTYAEVLALPDDQCLSLFYASERKRCTEPDWFEVNKQLSKPKVTLGLVYQQYERDVSPNRRHSFTTFWRRYQTWKQENGIKSYPAGNNEYAPGERLEIDFVGDSIEWVNPDGEICKSRLFVASLPYSKLIFTKAYENETQQSWLDGIIEALEYIGGVPQVLVMDNAKALVRHTDWQEGDIQPAVQSLCRYYRMQPWACKPATPKQKNRVEAAACDVERWIIAKMSVKQLPLAFDLDDLNRQIRERLDEINNQPFRQSRTGESRRSKFLTEEQSFLGPLPKEPYETGDWKLLVADKAHCIRIASDGGHRYSVPYEYTGKKVGVRVCRHRIEIFNPETLEQLGIHERCFSARGAKTHILEEHLTAAEKNYRRSVPEWISIFIVKGMETSVATEFVNAVFGGAGNYPGGRTCNSVSALFRRYKPEIITNAISAALESKAVSYHRIKALCERYEAIVMNNQTLSLTAIEQTPQKPISHSNIRNDYE